MNIVRREPWTRRRALEDALQYKSRSEWKRSSYGYEIAQHNGWLEAACKHMEGGKGKYQKGYWTLERCQRDARKYSKRSEWRAAIKPNGYIVAKNQGWLNQCCVHMEALRKPNGHWNRLENCLEDAARFKSLSSWEKHSSAAVASARRNGWITQCTDHMGKPPLPAKKWPIPLIKKEAAQYMTISEWRSASPNSYRAASRAGILDSLTSNMASISSLGEHEIRRYFISRDILFEAQKKFKDCRDKARLPFDFYLPDFKLLIEFQGSQHLTGFRRDPVSAVAISRRDAIKINFARKSKFKFLAIWNVLDITPILNKTLIRIAKKSGQNFSAQERPLTKEEARALLTAGKWNLESCIASARDFKSKSEWARSAPSAYSVAHKNGWLNHCSNHMKALWEKKWTLESLRTEAAQYETKGDWQMMSPNSYAAAHKKGWVDKCSSHMKLGRMPNNYWTKSRCIHDAKKYKSLSAWRDGSPSAYVIAKTKGWTTACCRHMTAGRKPNGYWTIDRCHLEAKKHQSKPIWREKSVSSYTIAKRRGWIQTCCAHMTD